MKLSLNIRRLGPHLASRGTCRRDRSYVGRKLWATRRALLRRAVLALAVLAALIPIAVQTVQAQTETVLYSFAGPPDGRYPYGRLTPDGLGNFYGATSSGGANTYYGDIFELSPEPAGGCPSGSNPGNGWCETVLYNFCSAAGCADGWDPYYTYLTFDTSGNLYGTAYEGGAFGAGIIFQLSPEPLNGCPIDTNPGNGWCETVLYNFEGGSNSANPSNGLVWDSAGNLYGTCHAGGEPGVFELSPNGSGGWTEKVIYSVNMEWPGLAIDPTGNLYGVDAEEHVFKLSQSGGIWTATNIHTFSGAPKDGTEPMGTPVVDSAGNVYGTTYDGGKGGDGTVWKLTPVTTGKDAGTYKEKILHSFTAPSEKKGLYPWAGVTLDSSGNIFGTTTVGKYGNYGTVFELAASGDTYKFKLLWSFNDTDGGVPYDSLILDSSGNLYGTTENGADGYGVVFEVKP